MSKITIGHNSFSILSEVSCADIKKAQAGRPNSVMEFEGEGEKKRPVFAVSVGAPGVNGVGVSFAVDSIKTGKAVLELPIPAGTEMKDVKGYVADQVGFAKKHLDVIEAQIIAAISEIDADRQAVLDSIEDIAEPAAPAAE